MVLGIIFFACANISSPAVSVSRRTSQKITSGDSVLIRSMASGVFAAVDTLCFLRSRYFFWNSITSGSSSISNIFAISSLFFLLGNRQGNDKAGALAVFGVYFYLAFMRGNYLFNHE